jgi:hypothetical protein
LGKKTAMIASFNSLFNNFSEQMEIKALIDHQVLDVLFNHKLKLPALWLMVDKCIMNTKLKILKGNLDF